MTKAKYKIFDKSTNVCYHIDNMLAIKFPPEINVDWCEFTVPKIKYDTKQKKVIIELTYEELE